MKVGPHDYDNLASSVLHPRLGQFVGAFIGLIGHGALLPISTDRG
jgi:hypothetical protein